jgi:hypothetical protein
MFGGMGQNAANMFPQFHPGFSPYDYVYDDEPLPQEQVMKPEKQESVDSNKTPEMIAAEKDPNNAHFYKKKGNDLFAQKKFKEAIEEYTKAIVYLTPF